MNSSVKIRMTGSMGVSDDETTDGEGTKDDNSSGQPAKNDTQTLTTDVSQADHDYAYPLSTDGLAQSLDAVSRAQAVNTSMDHRNFEADRPEISLQIQNVEHALQALNNGPVGSEITTHLSQLVPKVICLERRAKIQETLRGIFEDENQKLKSEVVSLAKERDKITDEVRILLDEVAELKRVKEDEQLGEFDFVTSKEAGEIRHAQKIELEQRRPDQIAEQSISKESHFLLQHKYGVLKKKLEEIIKVNHSWDDHYNTMKKQLLARNAELKEKLAAPRQQELMNSRPPGSLDDQQSAQSKVAGALAEVLATNQKCEKLENYARALKGQRNDLQNEITRLNEALSKRMTIPSAPPLAGERQPPSTIGLQSLLPEPEPVVAAAAAVPKLVKEMTPSEMQEEIELLRQQTDVYRSDFENERHDRQRVIGELNSVQKDLKRAKKAFSDQVGHNQRYNVQLQDVRMARHLQRDEERRHAYAGGYSRSAPAMTERRQPAHLSNYAHRYSETKTGHLVAHGSHYRYGSDEIDIDGSEGFEHLTEEVTPKILAPKDDMKCPKCETNFVEEESFLRHVNNCLD